MDPTFPSLPLLPCLFKTSSLDSKEVAVILEASLKLRRTWGFFFLERGTHFRGSGVFPCFWAKRWLSFLVLLTQNCLVVEPTHLKNISQTGSFPQNRGETLKPSPGKLFEKRFLLEPSARMQLPTAKFIQLIHSESFSQNKLPKKWNGETGEPLSFRIFPFSVREDYFNWDNFRIMTWMKLYYVYMGYDFHNVSKGHFFSTKGPCQLQGQVFWPPLRP